MNKGNLFSSAKKTTLTVINVVILGIACAIVCFASLQDSEFLADKTSVDWVSTSRESLSMRARPMLAGPVRTTPPNLVFIMVNIQNVYSVGNGCFIDLFW